MAIKYRVMKYDGDDSLSYAVFKASEVKGLTSPICYGQARPLYSGCSRAEANHYKTQLEKE